MRLVAVAVDDGDIARRQQRLLDHLVRRRRAVGDEEHAVAAERTRRHVLRALDRPGGLQQRVETARRRRRLRQEQRRSVELAHVADPVRLEDRLAAGDGQGVEGADRALRVALEVVEVGRLEPLGHALDDAQVDLQRLLDAVEDAADVARHLGVAGDLTHVAPGQEIHVQLGTDALQRARQLRALLLDGRAVRLRSELAREQLVQDRRVVLRRERKAVIDHDGLDTPVEQRGQQRVLEAADDDALVHELILGPAQATQIQRDRGPARGRRRRDDQRLEVRPPRVGGVEPRRQAHHAVAVRAVVARLPVRGIGAVAARQQRVVDASHQPRDIASVALSDLVLDRAQQARARVREEAFGRTQLRERDLDGGTGRPVRLDGPRLRHRDERVPALQARLGGGEQAIDALGMWRRGLHRDVSSLTAAGFRN